MSQTNTPIEIQHHSAFVRIQTSSSGVPPATESVNQPTNKTYIIQELVDPPGTPQQQPMPAASATQAGSSECGVQSGSPKQEQHHHHHHHHHLSHPGTGGSITIMTPPNTDNTSRINICINNHFPLVEAKPEVRRHHDQFGLSDDVLVHDVKGGLYYLGTITAIGERKCLVQFDDGTERWAAFEDLRRPAELGKDESGEVEKNQTTSSPADEPVASGSGRNGVAPKASPTCVMCKEHDVYRVVKVCVNCERGFHLRCHGMLETDTIVKDEELTPLTPLTSTAQLPYDMRALEWDSAHQVNANGHYCYCGADGDWMKEMIQCCWCEQWFHGRCIRSLQYPIFLGDRHYLFLCSICNQGHEFVRRVELPVSDLLHLVLYNLIMRNGHRLFDLNRAIVPFIEDNLRTLQLPEHLANMSPSSRREAIASTLKGNSVLFVNGTEMGLSFGQQMWTLRKFEAPSRIGFHLPRGQTITENVLRKERPTLRFLPRVNLERSFITDAMSRERMTGIAYSQQPFSLPDPRSDPFLQPGRQQMATDHPAAGVNGNGSALRMHAEQVPTSSNRRKYPPPFKLPIHPSMHSCAMDEIFPPPPDYRGSNNPFYTDPDAPPTVPRPRQARIVKRRLSGQSITNGRKKKRLNNSVGVMMLGPQPRTSRGTAQAPRPAANIQPAVGTSSVDVPERAVRATRSGGNHPRNLRPRDATNYSERRRYRARRSAATPQQSATDNDTVDGGSGSQPRSRSLSVSSNSSSLSAASTNSITLGDCLMHLSNGEVIVLPTYR
ncbi:hypothetical protein ZHAS_00020408 [Anopheles sinensis]|uniref:PHD-type domain-containing protein n=1 Tax=Anopheles sinensis TaxID=74873 RepID=A0A084WPZ5_ANOSI|nr:hypothetical protein ZHAS_00020408 [Anopheles sinensis]